MRKVVLLLAAIFIAAPAMAVTSLEVVDLGGCWAEIRYDAIGEAELPRAFGLRISVDGGETITDVDVTSAQPFDIYLGTIEFGGDPLEVTVDGTPVAPSADPGAAGTGLGTSEIVVEMASLYNVITLPPADIPADNGLLIKVQVSGNCNMSVVVDSTRGGVVMEDSSAPAPDVSQATSEPVNCDSECMMATHPDRTNWDLFQQPDCWCYAKQCKGDADGLAEGPFWVSLNDLNILRTWLDYFDPLDPNPLGGACANFDRLAEGPFWVSLNDLNILRTWLDYFDPAVPMTDCDATHIDHWIVPQ